MGPEGPQRVWSGLSSWGIFNPTHSLPSPLTCQAQMMVHSRCSLSIGMSSPHTSGCQKPEQDRT